MDKIEPLYVLMTAWGLSQILIFIYTYIKDERERRHNQKLLDATPYKFINSSAFAVMIQNCTPEQAERLIERYKE